MTDIIRIFILTSQSTLSLFYASLNLALESRLDLTNPAEILMFYDRKSLAPFKAGITASGPDS
jgi:hypothetical protein